MLDVSLGFDFESILLSHHRLLLALAWSSLDCRVWWTKLGIADSGTSVLCRTTNRFGKWCLKNALKQGRQAQIMPKYISTILFPSD